jgi:WD40 repeat protein
MASTTALPEKGSANTITLSPLATFRPDLHERAWCSIPHPTLPLLATAHGKVVTVFSLATLSKHSIVTGGHTRSVRHAAWRSGLAPHKLCLITSSFDMTAGIWRWDGDKNSGGEEDLAVEVTQNTLRKSSRGDGDELEEEDPEEWEFSIVLEGHDSEIKHVAVSPSGQFIATCSRDKSVWIWEDVGAGADEDEWETLAVLTEHRGDVKAVEWCPDVPGRTRGAPRGSFSADMLASASYDDEVRLWREIEDGEWECVAVLEGHAGTVWGIQWEGRPRAGDKFPRLLTYSADRTIRIWSLKEEDVGEDAKAGSSPWPPGRLGGVPNTMRRSRHEEWVCTAVLPVVHTRDIYSATWSPTTGLVASTGSDGVIAVYAEDEEDVANIEAASGREKSTTADEDEDTRMTSPPPMQPEGHSEPLGTNSETTTTPGRKEWKVLTTMAHGHGAYEINHITWSKRFDAGTKRKGVEEMLVTTGDDGTIRPWQVTRQGALRRWKKKKKNQHTHN